MSLTCPACGANVPMPKATASITNMLPKHNLGDKLKGAIHKSRPNPGVRLPRGETRFMKGKGGDGLL